MFIKVNIGYKYNMLTVLDDLGIYQKEGTSARRHYYRCRCDCGKEKIVCKGDLTSGKTISCGCYSKSNTIKRNRRQNEYHVYDNVIFVKFSNSDRYFLCDLDDLRYIENYCWYEDKHGYAVSNKNKKRIVFHRIVMNAPKNKEVDHIFQVSRGVCDNRKTNLRLCTHQENMENSSLYKNNNSGHAGVSFDKRNNVWVANISVKSKNIYLGVFKNKEEAIKARKEGEVKYRDKVVQTSRKDVRITNSL